MKKHITLPLALALVLALAGTAQALGTTINFDDLTIGTDNAADQVGGRMTTWGDAPGGGNDANIVANPASGGTGNAMYIAKNDDLVVSLGTDTNVEGDTWEDVGPTTSGTVTLSFDLWVDAGKYAYWNIQGLNGTSNEWAVDIYYGFDLDNGEFDAAMVYTGCDNQDEWEGHRDLALVFDQWVTVVQTLNLDNNTYALSIGGSPILSLDSVDSFSYWNGLLGTDFYSYNASSEYYVDNISFNLDSTYGGDPVPEPATLSLLGLGLAGMAARRLRRKA